MIQKPPYGTLRHVAQVTGISYTTVRSWYYRGVPRHTKLTTQKVAELTRHIERARFEASMQSRLRKSSANIDENASKSASTWDAHMTG